MDAPLPHVICPHCGADNPLSPIVTMCSKCFGSLEGAKPAAEAAPVAAGPVTSAPVTSVTLSSVPVQPFPAPAPIQPLAPAPAIPTPPPPPAAGPEPDLDIQLQPEEPDVEVTLEPATTLEPPKGPPVLLGPGLKCPDCGHWIDPLDRECLYCGRTKSAAEPPGPPTNETHPSSSVGTERPQPANAKPGCGCRTFIFLLIAFCIFRPDRMLRVNPGEMVAWVVVQKQAEHGTEVYVRTVVWPVGKSLPTEFTHLAPGVADRIRADFNARATDPAQARWQATRAYRDRQLARQAAARAGLPPPPELAMPTGLGEKKLLCRLRWAGLFEPALYDFTVYDPSQEPQLRTRGPN